MKAIKKLTMRDLHFSERKGLENWTRSTGQIMIIISQEMTQTMNRMKTTYFTVRDLMSDIGTQKQTQSIISNHWALEHGSLSKK